MYANHCGCDGERVYYDGCSLIAMNGKVLARCSFYAWILLLTLDSTIAMHGKVLARCSVSQRHFARNDAIRSHEGAIRSHASTIRSHATAIRSHATAIRSHATAIRSHASTIRSSNCWCIRIFALLWCSNTEEIHVQLVGMRRPSQ